MGRADSLSPQAISRTDREGLHRSFDVVRIFFGRIGEPALWYECLGVVEIRLSVVSSVMVNTHGRLVSKGISWGRFASFRQSLHSEEHGIHR